MLYMYELYTLLHHVHFAEDYYLSHCGLCFTPCGISLPVFQRMEMSQTACNCSAAIEMKRMGITQEDEAVFSLNYNIIITANKEQIECTQSEQN